jgi:mannose/cellobiose epimerase-like protein (N-acyl-D-glucosamine 2-epimerase family)
MSHVLESRIKDWMFNHALPFWAEHGQDTVHGGTLEELALDYGASDPGFKRVRVPCRQIYVWSHASLLGWAQGIALAKSHYEVLVASAWQGSDNGWARLLSSDNSIKDGNPDLYDTAFCLFALGWYYRASGEQSALDLALETLTFVEDRMAHPKGGFHHALPSIGPRLQNPHMHLLEASLACFEASGHPRFEAMARKIVALFLDRFYQPATQTLCEYFEDDWTPLTGEKGRIVEPGHQLEWAWILAQAHRLFGLDVTAQARGLIASAEQYGVDRSSFATYNSVDVKGALRDAGSRTWPNTERVKAAVAGKEILGLETDMMLAESLTLLLDRYLAVTPYGGWLDAFDQSGHAIAKTIPVSTFYHVFLAFAEVLRTAKTG